MDFSGLKAATGMIRMIYQQIQTISPTQKTFSWTNDSATILVNIGSRCTKRIAFSKTQDKILAWNPPSGLEIKTTREFAAEILTSALDPNRSLSPGKRSEIQTLRERGVI